MANAKGSASPSPETGKDEVAKFPMKSEIENCTPNKLVFPVVSSEIFKPYSKTPVVFTDESQLARFVSDAKQLIELHGWIDGIKIDGESV